MICAETVFLVASAVLNKPEAGSAGQPGSFDGESSGLFRGHWILPQEATAPGDGTRGDRCADDPHGSDSDLRPAFIRSACELHGPPKKCFVDARTFL